MLNEIQRQRAVEYLKSTDKAVSITELSLKARVNYYSISDEDLDYFKENGFEIVKEGKRVRIQNEKN